MTNAPTIAIFLCAIAVVLIWGARIAIWIYDKTFQRDAFVCMEADRAADDDDWGK